MQITSKLSIFLVLFVGFLIPSHAIAEKAPTNSQLPNTPLGSSHDLKSIKSQLKASINHGVKFLRGAQKDGKWLSHPGVTALCLQAIFGCHRQYNDKDGPWTRQPVEYLLSVQQDDGAFYDPHSRTPTKNYSTALAILALEANGNPSHRSAIEKARDFLVRIQADEGEGYDPEKDYFYGGIGYGGDERPDLSNLQLALEALKASGLPKDHEAYKKALIFIRRCQDREGNTMQWAGSSGGFAYSPDLPTNRNLPTEKGEGEVVVPYGSMTFAGLKSLVFCDVPKDDPRIQDALRWINNNFSVEKHPKFGQHTLYYYYQTLAKALDAAEVQTVQVNGKDVDWRYLLGKALIERQKQDGSWVNSESGKYMEGVSELCTAYALNALNVVYKGL